MKNILMILCILTSAFLLTGCFQKVDGPDMEGKSPTQISKEEAKTAAESETKTVPADEKTGISLLVGEKEVPVNWEENESVEDLKKLLPLSISMSMYGGFEQVGSIGQAITGDDTEITTDYGDIVLYSSDRIVLFYGSNTWEYTRLGHIDLSKQDLEELLGNGDVKITIRNE